MFGERTDALREERERQKAEEAARRRTAAAEADPVPPLAGALSDADAMAALGLPPAFASTKGRHIGDARANAHGARVQNRRKFRQVLNRAEKK